MISPPRRDGTASRAGRRRSRARDPSGCDARRATTSGCVGSRGRGASSATSSRMRAGPLRQHEHAVGELRRLLDVVRHEHDRARLLAQERASSAASAAASGSRATRTARPSAAGRVAAERARQLDALPHAARELVRIVRARTRSRPIELEQRVRAAPRVRAGSAQVPQAEQRCSRAPSATGTGRPAGTPCAAAPGRSHAPARRLQPARAQVQQRRLAAAGRADERDELAVRAPRGRSSASTSTSPNAMAHAGQTAAAARRPAPHRS